MTSYHKRLTRQLDLLPLDKLDQKITIIGAGAVGSFTALTVAKMGFCNIEVWDYDKIEIENMNCQFYRTEDIGKFKVEALKELVESFTDIEIVDHCARWTNEKQINGIVIMAVDSMSARIELYKYCSGRTSIPFIIDSRMGGESILMYTVDNSVDTEWYTKTLYSDEDAEHERCTSKSTMYTVNLIAGLLGKVIKDIINNNTYTRVIMWDVADNSYLGFNSKGGNNV